MRETLIRKGFDAVDPRPEMRLDSGTGRHDWQQSESIRTENRTLLSRRSGLIRSVQDSCVEITTRYKE